MQLAVTSLCCQHWSVTLCVVYSVIVDHARAPGERRPPGRGRGGYGYGYGGGYGGGFGGRSRGGGYDRYSTVTILHCFNFLSVSIRSQMQGLLVFSNSSLGM